MAERDIRGLDLAMLRTFDALLRERSVSRAAKRLFLSQPAVSASLNRLRAAFGDPLFTRTAHGVLPTARALALAPRVEQLLADLSLLLEDETGFNPTTSQRIFRIAGNDPMSRLVLPPLGTQLAAMGSRIRICWELMAFSSMPERLRKSDIDIALIPGQKPPRELESASAYADHYVAVCRHGHPRLAHGVSLDGFCAEPHVFFGYGTSTLDDRIDELLAASGRSRLTQIAVTSFGQMADILQRTDHVSVMPSRVARSHGDSLAAFALPFDLPGYELFVCWDRRAGADSGVMWLQAQLLRIAAAAAPLEIAPR